MSLRAMFVGLGGERIGEELVVRQAALGTKSRFADSTMNRAPQA